MVLKSVVHIQRLLGPKILQILDLLGPKFLQILRVGFLNQLSISADMEIMPYGSADTKLTSLMVPPFVCTIKEPVNHIKECSRMDTLSH